MRPKIMFACMLIASTAATREANRTRRYALRDIRIEGLEGAEAKTLSEQLRNAVEFWLDQHDQGFVQEDMIEKALEDSPELRTCADKRCAVALGDRIGATRLLSMKVERRGGSYGKWDWDVQILAYAVDAYRMMGPYEIPCRACSAPQLLGDLAHSLETVVKSDAAVPLCTLKVDSRPAAAKIAVDTSDVGTTPFLHTMAAGRHAIVIEADGFARGQTEVECPARGKQDMVFTLSSERTSAETRVTQAESVHAASVDRVSSPSRRTLFFALGGLSAALFAGSAAGLGAAAGYHGQPTCDGCTHRYSNLIGIGLTAAATAAFGAAAIGLFVKGAKEPAAKRTAWFAPTIYSSGASLVAGTSF